MAEPKLPEPVKQVVAVLWSDPTSRDRAVESMVQWWGPIDFTGPDHPFDATDSYRDEMGERLCRRLVAFSDLVPPETLADAKRRCNALEAELADGGRRRVNLDVGYLDHNKLVLASVKPAGQKIHLGSGFYAELVARWKAGRYQPFEWAFPDFMDGRYDPELTTIRERYLEQLRQGTSSRSELSGAVREGLRAAMAEVDAYYRERGIFQAKFGFGSWPALVVIDMAYGWTDPAYAGGSARLDTAVAALQRLLSAARQTSRRGSENGTVGPWRSTSASTPSRANG